MAKETKLTKLEEEVVDYYMEDYLENVKLNEDNSMNELEKLVLASKHGEGYRAPRTVIDWGKVFDKHACPSCGSLITLGEKEYACSKCGLRMPLELYDRAQEHYKKQAELMRKGAEYSKKISEGGIKDERVQELYDIGVDRALNRLSESEKKSE